MPTSNKEVALISLASGSLTLAGYFVLKRLLQSKAQQSKIYEEKALLDQYMLFNFSEQDEFLLFDELKKLDSISKCLSFPKRVALLCRDHCPDIFFNGDSQPRTALDIGCAVGRSCFELSKLFNEVIGIDYSANFIKHCIEITNRGGDFEYEATLEGDISRTLKVRLDPDVNLDRCKFEVGDACHLREDLGEFDLVLASNLICRLVDPKPFLTRLKKLVKSKRYVILSTPFSWGAQYTPKVNETISKGNSIHDF